MQIIINNFKLKIIELKESHKRTYRTLQNTYQKYRLHMIIEKLWQRIIEFESNLFKQKS